MKDKIREVLRNCIAGGAESAVVLAKDGNIESAGAYQRAILDVALTSLLELMPRWVLCSERLPDMNVPVFGMDDTHKEAWIVVRMHDEEIDDWNWFFVYANKASGCSGPTFLHYWHPLPEPPAKEGE